jgi:hypothetical protein
MEQSNKQHIHIMNNIFGQSVASRKVATVQAHNGVLHPSHKVLFVRNIDQTLLHSAATLFYLFYETVRNENIHYQTLRVVSLIWLITI